MVVRRLAVQEAKRTIRELIENWVLWRDAGDWERFRTVWHRDDVKLGLPGLVGDAVDRLYEEGRAWLDGSERPGVPL